VLTLPTNASDTHIGGMLQQQVGGHWQPLGFFSRRLSAAEANYSTFDRELLAAHQAINHFLPQVKGCAFQLWMDHKPLVAAMTCVMPSAIGRRPPTATPGLHLKTHLQRAAHPWCGQCGGGHPEPPPLPPCPVFPNQVQVVNVAATAVADADLSPLDIKEMALQQILCPQVQNLLHQPGLKIGYKQVGDLKLCMCGGMCQPAHSGPWCCCLIAARYLTTCTALHKF
jgi:hypothetical protein